MHVIFNVLLTVKRDDGVMKIVKQTTKKKKETLNILETLLSKFGKTFYNYKVKYVTVWKPRDKNIVMHPLYKEHDWIIISTREIYIKYINAYELAKKIETFKVVKSEYLLKILNN